MLLKITYLYHSGFAVSGFGPTLLFDYFYQGARRDPLLQGILAQADSLAFLCSHQHPDHFHPSLLSYRALPKPVQYVFSEDILDAGLAKPEEALYVRPGQVYPLGDFLLHVYGSTDLGVSFVCAKDGYTLFHAGDLNNWHWNQEASALEAQEMEDRFLSILHQIQQDFPHLDVAMFPVDPRLGKDYRKGAAQFVQSIDVDLFIPMHFGSALAKAQAFAPFAPHQFWAPLPGEQRCFSK